MHAADFFQIFTRVCVDTTPHVTCHMSHVTCHMSRVAPHVLHPSSQLRMQTAACKLEQLGYQGRVDDELRGRQLQVTGGACRPRETARADGRVMQRAHVAVQPAVPNVVQSAGGA